MKLLSGHFLVFFLFCTTLLAQKEWSVYGTVYNEKQKPQQGITVTNVRSKAIVVSDKNGNFYTRAAVGDTLIASSIGFGKQAIVYQRQKVAFALKEEAIALEEVVVTDKRNETLKREIDLFLSTSPNAARMKREILGGMVTPGVSNGQAGMGVGIDALYELWSKEGKSRRKAAELKYQDAKEFYASLRYNKYKVAEITGLKDEGALEDFMSFCQLETDFILQATDYDLTYQIFACLRSFQGISGPQIRRRY